jgi:hypothetical protein
MRILALAMLALGVSLTGCSYSNLGLARTLDKGRVQFAAAPGGMANVGNYSGKKKDTPYGQLDLAVRYGVTDHTELGLKLWLGGAVVDGKLSLLRSDGNSGIDVAIDPGLGIRLGNVAPVIGVVQLPVLIGFNFGGNQLVLAPKLVDEISLGSLQMGHTLLVGSSVGYAFKVGNNFRLMPEVTVMYPTLTNSSFSGASSVIVQGGVGLLFGG